MTILVLNPNSSTAVTQAMHACLAPLRATSRHAITCTELPDAPIGIETDADVARVAPMVADVAARGDARALVVACFSDPGVTLARARGERPVIGMAEAAYCSALMLGARFGVISLGPASIARHAKQIATLGLTGRLAGDRSAGMSVAEGHERPDAAARLIATGRDLIDRDGAEVLILGCAGLGRHRAAVQDALSVPVVDPVQAGVAAAIQMLDLDYPVADKVKGHANAPAG